MRVAYLFSENLNRCGGGTVHCLCVATSLQKLGHAVTIIAPKYFGHLQVPLQVDVWSIPVPGRSKCTYVLFQLLVFALWPFFSWRKRPTVLLIRTGPGLTWLCALFAKVLGARVVLEVNGVWWHEMRSRRLPAYLVALGRISAWMHSRCADAVIAVTEAIGTEFSRSARFPHDQVFAIHNGANPDDFNLDRRNTERQRHGICEDQFVVGMASLFTPWHGILEAIRSLRALPERIRAHVRLVLLGDGELREAAQKLVQEEQLQRLVLLPGMVTREEVASWLICWDVGLFICSEPSKLQYPGSPLKFFEYLAAGLPVIVTDDSHLTPMVNADQLGLVIPNASPQAIATAITEVFHNRSQFAQVGRQNRRLAETKYSWDAVSRRVADVLEGRRTPETPSTVYKGFR